MRWTPAAALRSHGTRLQPLASRTAKVRTLRPLVDLQRAVGTGLEAAAEALDAVVVARADPRAPEPFNAAAAEEAVAAWRTPRWRGSFGTPRRRSRHNTKFRALEQSFELKQVRGTLN